MSKIDRMIKLFTEEISLSTDIDRAMPWMTEKAYRRNQDSLRKKYKKNQEKQEELAGKMTFEEKEELYIRTDINLNEL